MNAIDFLIKEHNKVRKLFADMNAPGHREKTRRKLFDTIHEELLRHEKMEQTVWYPHLKSDPHLKDKIKHLVSEEQMAEKLMNRLTRIKASANWESEAVKLQEDVEHHASEEETELFPEVKKIMDGSKLDLIGHEMYEFKKTH